jgi:hypothetical protein
VAPIGNALGILIPKKVRFSQNFSFWESSSIPGFNTENKPAVPGAAVEVFDEP